MRKIITKDFQQTREEGKKVAQTLRGGEVICLEGKLGAGKTTFTQGILEELRAEKPYTSPTFMIIKEYALKISNSKFKISNKIKNQKLQTKNYKLKTVYHIDTYRVSEKDILDLGWEEIIAEKNNIVIIEWPERIKNLIPSKAIWIKFRGISENEREIKLVKR